MYYTARFRSILLGSVAAFCLPHPVAAQTAADGPVIQLDQIVVEGKAAKGSDGKSVKGYVASDTVTGSKTDTPVLEVPQSVSTVTRDQIEDRAAQNVGDALTYSAGVVGSPWGTDPRFDSPYIRDFSAADSMYLNGLKLMRSSGMIALEPYGFERIDVLRGPSSVLYGQGNPGGLINYVSKRPRFGSFGEVAGQIGTFDRYTGKFDFGGPVSEGSDVAYRLTGLARSGGTQQDHVEDDRVFFAPSVTWSPDAATSLTVLASVQHDKPISTFGLPNEYTIDASGDDRLSRSLYLGEQDFDRSSRTFSTIGYEFSHEFDNGWQVRQNARYAYLNWDYQNLYYSGLDASDPTVAQRGASYNDEKLGTFTIDNQVQKDLVTGPFQHTLLAGLDYRRHHVDTWTGFGTAPSIDIFDPHYGADIPENIWYESKVDGTIKQTGVYAQDQVRLANWLLTAGLRHDWADTQSDTKTNFGDTEQDQKDHAWTYRTGLTYLFDSGFAPYVSYSTSFEPVIGSLDPALGGDAFKPSKGRQYEAGIKYQPTGWNGLFTAAVYDLKQTNVLTSEVRNGVSYDVQTGEIRVKGVELSALTQLTEGLKLILNYTYTDAEITAGENEGNRPANVPKNAASAWLDYTLQTGTLAGLGFGGGVRYVGSRYDLDTNANKIDSNTLFDAAIHYERDHYKASLNINNIADTKYVSSCGSFGCYYGDGRTITAQVSYKW